MGKPSVDQQFALLSALGANTGWGSLTTDQVQLGITEAPRAGAEFTLFVRNGFRMVLPGLFRETGELAIPLPALPRPTLEEIKARYSWVDRIERDTSPTGSVTLRLATVLMPEEERIDGATYERRLIPHHDSLLGLQHRDWLIVNQDNPEAIPDPEVRAALKALLGKVYMDFSGLVVVHADGDRSFPYASEDGKRWDEYWRWFGSDFHRYGRIAVSSK